MRQSTIQDYNPGRAATLFAIIAAVVVAAVLALFAWHPWSPSQSYDTTTNNATQQQAPSNTQPAPQSQPQPQGT